MTRLDTKGRGGGEAVQVREVQSLECCYIRSLTPVARGVQAQRSFGVRDGVGMLGARRGASAWRGLRL
jgi:hypothetical protein